MKEEEISRIIEEGKEKAKFCYAPYSKIRVVAALDTDKGRFWGVNIENASYGLTICAERVAIFNAIVNGAKKMERIYVLSPDTKPVPCGACLQVMCEFADDEFEVVVIHIREPPQVEKYRLKELFPKKFRL